MAEQERMIRLRAKWMYEPATDTFYFRRAGDYPEARIPTRAELEALPHLQWDEVALLIEFLRERHGQLVTGFGLKRDPEDVKLLNRLVDVISAKK